MRVFCARDRDFDVVEAEFWNVDDEFFLAFVFFFVAFGIGIIAFSTGLEHGQATVFGRAQDRSLSLQELLLHFFLSSGFRASDDVVVDFAQLGFAHDFSELLHDARIDIGAVGIERPEIFDDVARLLKTGEQIAIELFARKGLCCFADLGQLICSVLSLEFKP